MAQNTNIDDLIPRTRYDDHLSRKFFHFSSATLVCFLFIFVFPRPLGAQVLISICSIFLAVDLLRLRWISLNRVMLKLVGSLMRKNEANSLSAQFYYILGMTYAVCLLPRAVAIQTLLTLAWMDPVAGVFGVRYGKHTWNSIFKKVFYDIPHFPISMGAKTVEGSLAGFVAAFLAGIVAWTGKWTAVQSPEKLWWPGPLVILTLSGVGAFVAMVAEAWPSQWDDNANIPFWTGLFVWAAALLLGIPLNYM